MTEQAPWNGDAPFSDNFYYTDEHGFNHQITIRAETGALLLKRIEAAVENLLKRGVTPKAVGKHTENSPPPASALREAYSDAPGQAQSAPPTLGVPLALQASAAPPEGGTAICAMIEIGTSYTSGKTQLRFHCDGFENPLTYTKSVESMVKLLAPLGFTAAHIVVGQKYPVNALVRWEQAGDYKNVLEVHAK